ncbi:hypothetical protein DUNSADRAFT_4374 [Dunaliella salina]|uniref:Encoded protein n=1 Tax=Dunaliella salina TaxID=3046 RepID=A0ABQ7GS59_DUNSA|nr:hypothetical protein DUNSADRAFT_4374 [Dunaliella salina]|eukprot:KAF5837458.1 hypothetical protein DUNSADRAFT_4374 [Dunaliella salina]
MAQTRRAWRDATEVDVCQAAAPATASAYSRSLTVKGKERVHRYVCRKRACERSQRPDLRGLTAFQELVVYRCRGSRPTHVQGSSSCGGRDRASGDGAQSLGYGSVSAARVDPPDHEPMDSSSSEGVSFERQVCLQAFAVWLMHRHASV